METCAIIYLKAYPGQPIKIIHPLILCLLLSFALIMGCRYGVGVDYFAYLELYEDAKFSEIDSSELLFNSFTRLFSCNDLHYSVYFGAISFIQITFLVLACKKTTYILPYVLLFFFIGSYYLGWNNVLRQNLVVALLLASMSLIVEKKIAYYYLVAFICIFIHISAVLLLLLYPLLNWTKRIFPSTLVQFSFFIICFCIGHLMDASTYLLSNVFLFNFLLNTDYSSYLIDENIAFQGAEMSLGLGYFIKLFNQLLLIGFSSKLRLFYNSKYFDFCYKLCFLGYCCYLLSGQNLVLHRLFLYFYSFEVLIIPFFFYFLVKNNTQNYYIRLCMFCYLLSSYLLLFFSIIFNGEKTTAKFTFFFM